MAELKCRAREMRKDPTEPEKRLWRELSGSRFEGFKFRRQEVIGRCIVDFWCPSAGLAIEVDGDTHSDPDKDARRGKYLSQFGVRVLHVGNPDVMQNIEGVMFMLGEALKAPPVEGRGRSRAAVEGMGAIDRGMVLEDSPHPNPSPEGEGLKVAISLEGSVG
jgi:very-short-patch-repair endonuclease